MGLIWYPAYHLAHFSGAQKEHFLLNDQIVERGKQLCEFSLFPHFTETRVERGNLSKASCKVVEGDESPSPSGHKASLSLWPSPAPCPLQSHLVTKPLSLYGLRLPPALSSPTVPPLQVPPAAHGTVFPGLLPASQLRPNSRLPPPPASRATVPDGPFASLSCQ